MWCNRLALNLTYCKTTANGKVWCDEYFARIVLKLRSDVLHMRLKKSQEQLPVIETKGYLWCCCCWFFFFLLVWGGGWSDKMGEYTHVETCRFWLKCTASWDGKWALTLKTCQVGLLILSMGMLQFERNNGRHTLVEELPFVIDWYILRGKESLRRKQGYRSEWWKLLKYLLLASRSQT